MALLLHKQGFVATGVATTVCTLILLHSETADQYSFGIRLYFLTGDIITIEVKAGEMLAFDYRVLHRALSHKGTENRPMLYYTFTKRWFTDAMNFADLPSLHEADEKVEG